METEVWYAAIDGGGFVAQFESAMEDTEGPNLPLEGAYEYRKLPGAPLDGGMQPTPHHVLKWTCDAAAPEWVDTRTADQVRADKVAELSAACAQYIVGGFTSAALGTVHVYPSAVLDQHNLNGLVTRSLYPGNPPSWTAKFWCADADNRWERRSHTASQLQQVGDEAVARITAAQAKCDELIRQANTVGAAGVAEIVWGEP